MRRLKSSWTLRRNENPSERSRGMTPHQIVRVDFTEIKSIEVTCQNCGAMFTLPLPKETLSHRQDCASCNKRLWEDATFLEVLGVFRSLSAWNARAERTCRLGFSLDASRASDASSHDSGD